MDEHSNRKIIELLTSMNNELKRLSEWFCSPESVDVAEINREGLIELIKTYLIVYDQGRQDRAFWIGLKDNSRESYAESMADAVLKYIQDTQKPPRQSEPLPD